MKTPDKCPCSGATLTKLVQPAILMLLAQQPLHGYAVVQRLGLLQILRGNRPDATGVYRLLRAMEGRGLVTCSWSRSNSGPAKRMYRLTASGTQCLERWVATLEDFDKAVTELLLAARIICRHPPRTDGPCRKKG
ncbi:MAG TPA: helix-turn-helix transcriptional regulator [Planctomycetota bacterium]|nr:helix-turn-helix transcriptional regulator [Planctomycetota bacterium]